MNIHELIGRRIRLKQTHDVYPTGVFEAGLTGTVSAIEGQSIMVKLDTYREELDDWDNQLEFNSEGWTDAAGREIQTIDYFLETIEFIEA